MRNIITDWLEEKNLTLDILLDHNKRNFTERAPLFEKDKMLLYPLDGARPNDLMERLDISLSVLLILHCKIFPVGPPKGWAKEPDPGHTDSASDIVRLRLLRNELYHSPLCAIVNVEFEMKWATLTDVLKRLGSVDYDVHSMKTCHFSQLKAQRKAYAKMIRELFSRDKYFVQKFIENTGQYRQKKEKLEVWMNAKDQGLRQRVAFEAMGYNRAKSCTKCNKLSNTICSHCSSKPVDTVPVTDG